MCGICGFFAPEDNKLLRRMADSLEHRGPDDDGFYSDRFCSLGMRRLSIIDVAGGRQPVHNENRDVFIVFNGEIYNYLGLRSRLSAHRFYTNSDTEAIVHAYEEFGEGCLRLLNGMFGFAIWDSGKRKLFVARDRFGEKPVYYTFIGRKLFFASEIKAILQNPEVRRVVNLAAFNDYLSFRCNSSSETFFRGIFKLPPAHYFTYDGKDFVMKRYWKPEIAPDLSGSEGYFSAQLFARLRESVRMRMMSEVPLGAYLSGGIDSGAVVGLMSSLSREPVRTFSVGFGHDFDELSGARFLASHFRTDHREVIVKQDAADVLPQVAWHLDEPMADPTCIPVFFLSREIKPFATVVLTGDGSDELLYGYEQFRLIDLHRRIVSRIPLPLRGGLHAVAGALPKSVLNSFFRYSGALGEKGMGRLKQFLYADGPAELYLSLVSVFDEAEKRSVLSGDAASCLYDMPSAIGRQYFRGSYGLDDFVRLDVDRILAENMLMRSDKGTMAFGVEQRVPFLDHTLAEFIYSIPPGLKLRGNVDKFILRKSMAKLIPRQTISRKKSRFFVPIHEWFSSEFGEISRQLLLSDSRFFRKGYVESLFRDFRKSSLYCSRQLWALLMFEVWHKLYIDSGLSSRPVAKLGDLV